MATIEEKILASGKKIYRARFVDWMGRRRSATHPVQRELVKLVNRIELEAKEIRSGLRPAPVLSRKNNSKGIEEALQEYLSWGRLQGGHGGRAWSIAHLRHKESRIRYWLGQLKIEVVGDLDGIQGQIERITQEMGRKRSGKTLANYVEALRSFCEWLLKRRMLHENPLSGLSSFNTAPQSRRRSMSEEELQRLLEVSSYERRILYLLAVCSGLRANELRESTPDHVDFKRGGLVLDARWTKNRKEGFQPLPVALLDELRVFIASGRAKEMYKANYRRNIRSGAFPTNPLVYVPRDAARTFRRDLEAAGISLVTVEGKLDFHALRVTYDNLVIESGASVKEAQELMRHSTPELTMNTYGRARKERLSELAEDVGLKVFGTKEPEKWTENGHEVLVISDNDSTENGLAESVAGFKSPPPAPFFK